MENKYITYEQYNNQINKYNQAIRQGFKPVIKKNLIKIGLGFVCLGIAIFPNGMGFWAYPIAFMFLGFSLFDIKNIYLPKLKLRIKRYIKGKI